jgi:hypothetical protein
MKEPAERAIDDILPPELKEAFRDYAYLHEVKDTFGKRIIDGEGNLKDTAEQYLANLSNVNKGNARLNAEEFKRLTGLDIGAEVQAVKDAQKLLPLFPTTGSRTQDILRALAASFVGTQALGPLGTAMSLAAISPRAVGRTALTIGKAMKKRGPAAAPTNDPPPF